MNNKTFLITGGCGFIGSCLIRELSKSKNNYIVNIDKLTYASNTLSIGHLEDKNYTFYKEDITDEAIVEKIFKKTNPDYVIHLAAESHVDRSIDSPKSFIDTNVIGTYNLLNSSYNYWKSVEEEEKKSFKFIMVSTDEVYGSLKPKEDKFNEETSYKPNSPYAASKASSDHLVRAWNTTYGLPTIITNTSNNYGPWQFPEKLIPLVIGKCLNNTNIPVYGDGKQIRDWIHVEDHVSGLLFVLRHGKSGEKYNIGSNNELTNIDVVKTICEILDELKPVKDFNYSKLITYVDDRPGHDTRYAIDSSKINELGWRSNITWMNGIRETILWYLNNQDIKYNSESKIYSGERLGKL